MLTLKKLIKNYIIKGRIGNMKCRHKRKNLFTYCYRFYKNYSKK